MKKNRYGNIEDLVLRCELATAAGKLERTALPARVDWALMFVA